MRMPDLGDSIDLPVSGPADVYRPVPKIEIEAQSVASPNLQEPPRSAGSHDRTDGRELMGLEDGNRVPRFSEDQSPTPAGSPGHVESSQERQRPPMDLSPNGERVPVSDPLYISESARRFGFSTRKSGGHMARSMMLTELRILLAAVPAAAGRQDYRAAILEGNALGKPTFSSRQKSEKHLYELYGLDPSLALFRLLRRFAAEDPESLPLLALVCVFCRDPQLRASFTLIETLEPVEVLSPARMGAHLESAFPERYSPAMKAALAKNVNTTWTASGHLQGVAVKRRALPQPAVAASVYAILAGYLLGLRGDALISSIFARIVGVDPSLVLSHLAQGAQRGWLRLRHGGGVIEIDFSALLTPQEEALLHGPS